MIVNSAYMYMGKKEPEPPKTELWTNGKLNYPFTIVSGNASFDSANNQFVLPADSSVIFSDIDLRTFETITLEYTSAGTTFGKYSLQAILPNGTTIDLLKAATNQLKGSERKNIPATAKNDIVKLKLGASMKTFHITNVSWSK